MQILKVLGLSIVLVACGHQSRTNKYDMMAENPKLEFDVKTKTLDNGMKILVVENDKLPLVSYYAYFNVGAKHEVPGMTGASHFLEHMMFKGAKKYKQGEFDKMIEGNGGNNNAYTSNDMTVYYENLPSEHIEKIIDIEADRMQHLALNEKAFESEKQVVLEERKMRYENSDRGKLYLEVMSEVFKGTAYGTSVIGSINDIKTVSREQVWEYFKKFYAPNNSFVVIVGDVNANKVLKTMERQFGSIARNENLEEQKQAYIAAKGAFEFNGKFGARRINLHGSNEDPLFMLAFKGVKFGQRQGFVLDILSSLLGEGQSSYLNKHYVYGSRPRLSNIYASNFTLQDAGVFLIGGQLLKNESLASVHRSLYARLKRSCQKGFSQRDLEKVKNQYLVSYFSGLDTNSGIARFLGDRQAYYGDYRYYKSEIDLYNSITLDEVTSACKEFLLPKNSLFVSIWNKHKKESGARNE